MIETHPAISDAKAVLFDFDFTLADSSVGIIACMNYALDKIGLPHRPDADILATVGLYIPDALVEMEGEKYRPIGMEFMSYFTEKADEVMMDGTRLYDDSPHTLRTLRRRRLRDRRRLHQVPLPHRGHPRKGRLAGLRIIHSRRRGRGAAQAPS